MVQTEDIKLVSDYTGAILMKCYNLIVLHTKLFLKMLLSIKMRSKPEGQEYLENYWLLTQTQPDKKNLRQLSKDGI